MIESFFHLSIEIVGRGDKCLSKNPIAAAAYTAGTKLRSQATGRTYDFTSKEVLESGILAPAGAPDWVFEREGMWNRLVERETRVDAQFARSFVCALPRELTPEQNLEVVHGFIQRSLVDRGFVADFGLHVDSKHNPHVHILTPLRSVGPDGFGPKLREFNKSAFARVWRKEFEEEVNLYLAEYGLPPRFDCRSYKDRGLDLLGQPKLDRATPTDFDPDRGPTPAQVIDGLAGIVDGRGKVEDAIHDYLRTVFRNGERLCRDPEMVFVLATEQQSTFTVEDLARVISKYTATARQFDEVMAKVMASPNLQRIGERADGRTVFTTTEILDVHRQLAEDSRALAGDRRCAIGSERFEAVRDLRELSEEQGLALRHVLVETGGLAIVEGYAGTGKTRMVESARIAWEAAGRRVVGAALAGKAAKGLADGAGIESRTLKAWEYAWKRGEAELRSGDVLVVDEAGMIGTKQMQTVLRYAASRGAKVVLLGDTRQLQAIDAGSPMRALLEAHGSVKITEVRRQRVGWQQEAAKAFGDGRPAEALRAYRDHGAFHKHRAQQAAIRSMVDRWYEVRAATPEVSQLMLAFRRDEVASLNRLARERLLTDGQLGESHRMTTADGERDFAVGERLYFLKNDYDLGVVNGSTGTLRSVEGTVLTVELDEGRTVSFDLGKYRELDYGYAATLHKAQGATVDRVEVLASRHFDQHAAYVAMTRHRVEAHLHWHEEAFANERELFATLAREQRDDDRELMVEAEATLEEQQELEGRLTVAEKFLGLTPEQQARHLEALGRLASRAPADPVAVLAELPPIREARRATQAALEELRDLRGDPGADPGRVEALTEASRNRLAELRKLQESPTLIHRARDRAAHQDRETEAAQRQLGYLEDVLAASKRRHGLEAWVAGTRTGEHRPRLAGPEDVGLTGTVVGTGKHAEVPFAVVQLPSKELVVIDLTHAGGEGSAFLRGRRVELTEELVGAVRPYGAHRGPTTGR